MYKIIAFFMITLFTRLYVRIGILPTEGKQMYDSIISIRGNDWVHKTSLIPATFDWSSCTKPGKWTVMYLFIRGVEFHWSSELFRQCDTLKSLENLGFILRRCILYLQIVIIFLISPNMFSFYKHSRIGGVIVRRARLECGSRGFEPQSGQTKDYKIGFSELAL